MIRQVTLSLCASVSIAIAVTYLYKSPSELIESQTKTEGILFSCNPQEYQNFKKEMSDFFRKNEISEKWYTEKYSEQNQRVVYTLNTPSNETSTLDIATNPIYDVKDALIELPDKKNKKRFVTTVSQKEIILALMQHGRLTDFSSVGCNVEPFKDHIQIRQITVAWSEKMEWIFPNGRKAFWNPQFWTDGTPKKEIPISHAYLDSFIHQEKYSVGCYTATKMVMTQGILDYYSRIKKDDLALASLETLLRSGDGEPLRNIEPQKMWYNEKVTPEESRRPGKILEVIDHVASNNFVPGDWTYWINTDKKSAESSGYEGSNSIYLGRNRFDDFYNDNNHFYTFLEKLDEIYQWSNEVYSRQRDASKIKPQSVTQLMKLSKTPEEGGYLMHTRSFPQFFQFPQKSKNMMGSAAND